MKQTTWIGISLGVAALLLGVEAMLVPSLQSAAQAVEADVAVRMERARRLLHEYQPFLAYHQNLTDSLWLDDEDSADPQDLSDEAADDYQDRHSAMWEAFQPTDWRDSPRIVRASYGSIDSQIRQGLAGRNTFLDENDRFLARAESAIGEALAVSSGEVSGRSHAEANRLKAVIEFYKGVAERLPATRSRADAQRVLRQLVNHASEAIELEGRLAGADVSQIEMEIKHLTGWTAEAESELTRQEAELVRLDEKITGLEERIDGARQRRDRARKSMALLQKNGLDFSQDNAPAEFADRMAEQDRVFREAMREIQSLEAGSYPYARIDASGDFLNGRYLENGSPANLTIQRGLRFYRNEREVVAAVTERNRTAVVDLRADLTRMESVRDGNLAGGRDAAERLSELREAISDTYAELNRLSSEAFAMEENALAMLDRSVKTVRDAVRCAGDWVRTGQEGTQGLSLEASQRSAFQPRSDDGWMGGFIAAQGADAHLARAWVFYDRFRSAQRTADVLDRLPESVSSADIDVESERTKSSQARDAGIEEVKSALAILERAHRDAERHWSIVAQGASTTYLLALFGNESYVDDAIEGYRNAVKGREDQPYVQRIVSRLRTLEGR